MAQQKGKTNHDEFESTVEAIRDQLRLPGQIILTEKQAFSVIEHGEWWLEFRRDRRDAAKAIKNPGKKRLPYDELTPSAKRSRKARDAKTQTNADRDKLQKKN